MESGLRDQAATLPPGSAQLHAVEKQIQAVQDKTDKLVASCPTCPALLTAGSDAALKRGDVKGAQGLADQAVAAAENWKSADRDAKLAGALNERGLIEAKAGDFEAALADAERVLKTDPKNKTALWIKNDALGRGKLAAHDAKASAEAARLAAALKAGQAGKPGAGGLPTVSPGPVPPELVQAQALFRSRDFRGALAAARRASEIDPSNPDAYTQQAAAWVALQNLSEALLAITKAIERLAEGDPRLPGAYTLRALYKNQTGDHAGAAADASAAITRDPNAADAYYERSRAEKALGQGAASLADLGKAAQLKPSDYGDMYAAGRAETAVGDAVNAPARGDGVWARLAAAVGGGFHLLVGGAVALLALFAVWVFAFAKKSSRARLKSLFTPAARRRDEESGGRREIDAQYDIVEQVGEGGMGMVYKGWDKVLKRPVAIKRLRAELQRNPRERDRFIREAEMVASLRHPHIVEIYNIVRSDEDTYLVFEYIVGQTVHQLLNECPGRHLPPARALEILSQTAEAVDHAHSRRVIHRDLKPANVMIADGGWVKVMDFGIARQVMDSMLTTTNTIVGTPVYMAPEQAMGAVVKESDVYALGCSLYEMLTGGLPFKGPDETRDKLDGRFVPPSILVPDLPKAVDEVVAHALSPRAEDRFHSCAELYRAAAAAFDDSVTPGRRAR